MRIAKQVHRLPANHAPIDACLLDNIGFFVRERRQTKPGHPIMTKNFSGLYPDLLAIDPNLSVGNGVSRGISGHPVKYTRRKQIQPFVDVSRLNRTHHP
jgi:hypothetical protein